MKKAELLRQAKAIAQSYQLDAEITGNLRSTGVQGDERTRTYIICLTGKFPGHNTLEKVSLEITNSLPVNRVIFTLGRKDSAACAKRDRARPRF